MKFGATDSVFTKRRGRIEPAIATVREDDRSRTRGAGRDDETTRRPSRSSLPCFPPFVSPPPKLEGRNIVYWPLDRRNSIKARRSSRIRKMNARKPRRDSDALLSKFSHKEFLFKFLVIGDYGVGKTALVRRYTEGRFTSNYKITIGADFAMKSLDWDPHTKINLQLWDVAGHERFGYMTRIYYKYAVAAALVFDISRIATFHSIKKWLNDLREKVTLPDGSNIPVVLLANKCDIPCPVVPPDQIAKFCKENNIGAWYVTSAKENTNVDVAMRYLVENVLKTTIEGGVRDSVRLRDRPTIREKTGCCKS